MRRPNPERDGLVDWIENKLSRELKRRNVQFAIRRNGPNVVRVVAYEGEGTRSFTVKVTEDRPGGPL